MKTGEGRRVLYKEDSVYNCNAVFWGHWPGHIPPQHKRKVKTNTDHSNWQDSKSVFFSSWFNQMTTNWLKIFDIPSVSHSTFRVIFICNQIKGSTAAPSASPSSCNIPGRPVRPHACAAVWGGGQWTDLLLKTTSAFFLLTLNMLTSISLLTWPTMQPNICTRTWEEEKQERWLFFWWHC